MTTESSNAAAPKKAAAARSEVNGKPKSLTFKKLKFELPAEMPAELMFDIVEIEASPEDETGTQYIVSLRILRSLLGPDQFIDVRNKLGSEPDQVIDLMGKALDKYGLSMGESSASQDS